MIFAQQGSVWFDIDAFAKTGLVQHGFSTRLGGHSRHPYSRLNLGLYTEDEAKHAQQNRLSFLQQFGYRPEDVFVTHQVHGNVVCVATAGTNDAYLRQDANRIDADAVVTNVPGCVLFTTFADCMPLLFLDPITKSIGVAHAGWRGTLRDIAGETIRALQKNYGANPADVLVALGPAIGPRYFEVGEDVIEQAMQLFDAKDKVLIRSKYVHKAYLDIRRSNTLLLERAGVRKEHIHHCMHDTYAENTLFFSHRRSHNGKTGRMGALIVLLEQ